MQTQKKRYFCMLFGNTFEQVEGKIKREWIVSYTSVRA